jgi:hypothetical protein
MPAFADLAQLEALPLCGQALLGGRMIRRAVMAIMPEAMHSADAERDLMMRACDTIEACARDGTGTQRALVMFAEARALRDLRDRFAGEREALRLALWWAVDASRAADVARELPFEACVTPAFLNAIAALGADRRINRLQITILVGGDIDLIAFACAEAGIGRFDGLTNHVLGRLPPVHALSLNPIRPTPEELAR